ncbi:hydroxysteroid dehydrogenase protein 2-like [Tropilaelaps mercedesae]|uniref:Hydroxysteroid dehydrogenase protein 2-like n=1 Tax=Tropilaelaps mercedesae TaxID=418985 RepID=A0A1V9XEN6_9ACAR|nr:hydroxysteroid dehydrogenase protein 2-like [Tropilaelaps mercedesae]
MDISAYLGLATRTEITASQSVVSAESAESETPKMAQAAITSADSVEGIFSALEAFINEDLVGQVKGVFSFNVKGEPEPYYVDLKNGSGACGKGKPPKGNPDVTLSMDKDTFMKMFAGQLNPTNAFMAGKLTLKGDLPVAMKLDRLMSQMRSKL